MFYIQIEIQISLEIFEYKFICNNESTFQSILFIVKLSPIPDCLVTFEPFMIPDLLDRNFIADIFFRLDRISSKFSRYNKSHQM